MFDTVYIHFTGTKNLALALEFGSNPSLSTLIWTQTHFLCKAEKDSDYRRMMWAMTSLPRLVEYTG